MEAPVPRDSPAASILVQQRVALLTGRESPLLLTSKNGKKNFAQESCAQAWCRCSCTTQHSTTDLSVPVPAQAAPNMKQKSCSRDSKASFLLACLWGMAHGERGATGASRTHLPGLQPGAEGAGWAQIPSARVQDQGGKRRQVCALPLPLKTLN